MHYTIDTFMTQGMGLAKTELLVYALIHTFSQGDGGCCWMSVGAMAAACGCSPSTAKEALRNLLAAGHIRKVGYHPEYRTCEYVAVVPAAWRTTWPETDHPAGNRPVDRPVFVPDMAGNRLQYGIDNKREYK